MYLSSIGCLGDVAVDLSVGVPLSLEEQSLDVVVSGRHAFVKVSAWILGVGALESVIAYTRDTEGNVLELGLEQVVLVEEQDHGSLGEPG